jgi:hypothetical protein
VQSLIISLLHSAVVGVKAGSREVAPLALAAGPALVQQLGRLASTALFLWVSLAVHNSGSLWDVVMRDADLLSTVDSLIVALASGGCRSGGDDITFQIRQRLQPIAAVALHALCSAIPVSSDSSPASALNAKTQLGRTRHPHGHVLELLLSQRPKPASPNSGNPAAASLFYALTEVLLRGTINAASEPREPSAGVVPRGPQAAVHLPQPLRRTLVNIVHDIIVSFVEGGGGRVVRGVTQRLLHACRIFSFPV